MVFIDVESEINYKKVCNIMKESLPSMSKDFIPHIKTALDKYKTPFFQIDYKRLHRGLDDCIYFELEIYDFNSKRSRVFIPIESLASGIIQNVEDFFSSQYVKNNHEIIEKLKDSLKKDLSFGTYELLLQKEQWTKYLEAESSFREIVTFRGAASRGDYVIPYKSIFQEDHYISSLSDSNFDENQEKLKKEIIIMEIDDSRYKRNSYTLSPFLIKDYEEMLKLLDTA